MRYLNRVGVIGLNLVLIVPSLALAGRVPPNSYDRFMLSPADTAALADDAHSTCMANAMRDANNLGLQTACNNAQIQRLNIRLDTAMGAALPSPSPTNLTRLDRNQRAWRTGVVPACEAKWGTELSRSSNSYPLAVSQCVATETYRRTLWLERTARTR